jgi:uncharacterized membrane protein SpoIIM required for sporulation
MDAQKNLEEKREAWEVLRALVQKASGRGGVASFSRAEMAQFGSLYRRASSDLACARSRGWNPDTVQALNALVGQAYVLLYAVPAKRSSPRAVWEFYLYEFPALLQRRVRLFWVAFGLVLGGGVFAYGLIRSQPSTLDLFIPEQFRESLEVWKQGAPPQSASADFSAMLFINNSRVGIIAATSGIVAGVPTALLLWSNGATLGAFAAVMTQAKQHGNFWPGVLPHGIAELTAIFICGAAGLMLGLALLLPGKRTRREALRVEGGDAIRLVLGSVPLFVFAGIIEGMFSHLAIPAPLRLAFAFLNGVLWYLYLFLPRPTAA